MRSTASAIATWVVLKLEDLGMQLLRFAGDRRRRRYEVRLAPAARPPAEAPEHADERTLRRIAEAERGGLSSEESDARYASGENPGGMHHKAVRETLAIEHQRPEQEEPQDRKDRVPGGERHIPVTRRGA